MKLTLCLAGIPWCSFRCSPADLPSYFRFCGSHWCGWDDISSLTLSLLNLIISPSSVISSYDIVNFNSLWGVIGNMASPKKGNISQCIFRNSLYCVLMTQVCLNTLKQVKMFSNDSLYFHTYLASQWQSTIFSVVIQLLHKILRPTDKFAFQ